MKTKFLALVAGATISLAAAAQPALARDIAVDADVSTQISACTIGLACLGTTMPFGIDTPAVSTNQIFIYSSGIVSLGSQLPLGATYGDASTLGHAFLAPGFADFGANLPSVYITNVLQDFGGFIGQYRVTWAFPNLVGAPIFQLELTDLSLSRVADPNDPSGFIVVQDPSKIGDISVVFAHGAAFSPWNGIEIDTEPGLPSGALVGWGVGALNSATLFGSDVSSLKTANIGVDLTDAAAYSPGIPEPGAWLLMLAGFGGLGVALRRARVRRPALAG
jgi:hypothetical protein